MRTIPATQPKGHEIGVGEEGHYYGNGFFSLSFQRGPIDPAGVRNGAFTEEILAVLIDRLEFFQTTEGGRLACDENAQALVYLRSALDQLNLRTARRVAQAVEGTASPHYGTIEGEVDDPTDVVEAG